MLVALARKALRARSGTNAPDKYVLILHLQAVNESKSLPRRCALPGVISRCLTGKKLGCYPTPLRDKSRAHKRYPEDYEETTVGFSWLPYKCQMFK